MGCAGCGKKYPGIYQSGGFRKPVLSGRFRLPTSTKKAPSAPTVVPQPPAPTDSTSISKEDTSKQKD